MSVHTQTSLKQYDDFDNDIFSPPLKIKHQVSFSTTEDSLSQFLNCEQHSDKQLSLLSNSNIGQLQNGFHSKVHINEPQILKKYNSIESYKFVGIIGRGTFGTVYKSIFLPTFQEVAIKKIAFNDFQIQFQNNVKELYNNQVKLMKTLQQKADFKFTCNFYGSFIHEECGYIAMQLIEGFSLQQLIQSQIQLTSEDGKFYLASLVLALEQLHHKAECIHRDIKPENLMVLSNGTLLLVDFGCAKILQKNQRTSSITGTCQYFSPSRFKCDYGVQADVWSLAVTAYQLITKDLPFKYKGIQHSQQQQKFTKMSSIVRKQKNVKFNELQQHETVHPNFRSLIQNLFNSIIEHNINQFSMQKIKSSRYFQQFQWDLLRNNKLKPPRVYSLHEIEKIREGAEIIFNNF